MDDEAGPVNKQDLERAVEPVREYFSGREITDNTVLAAYLRSEGMPSVRSAVATRETGTGRPAAPSRKLLPQPRKRLPPKERRLRRSPQRRTQPLLGRVLSWFPKQFGPGDIDGVGAKRLLGTPERRPGMGAGARDRPEQLGRARNRGQPSTSP